MAAARFAMRGRIALVTGASRGIGRSAALHLAKQGDVVIAVARSKLALEKLDDEIRAEQDRAAEARKSAFYIQGVWHEATCACNAPEVVPPEGSWVREYLMKSRFKMEE